jgi:hypothetical protein
MMIVIVRNAKAQNIKEKNLFKKIRIDRSYFEMNI